MFGSAGSRRLTIILADGVEALLHDIDGTTDPFRSGAPMMSAGHSPRRPTAAAVWRRRGGLPVVGRLGTSATPERLEEEAYEQAGGNDQPLRLGLAPKEVTNIELFIEQILRAASADYLIVDAELPGNEPLGTQQGGASLKPYRTDPGQRAVDCRRYRQGHAAPDACAIRSGLRGRD
jgi:hypothetical protein